MTVQMVEAKIKREPLTVIGSYRLF